MPVITVAIPAYKPRHLSQAIASVLAQTFGDFELIISDDCPDGAVKAVLAQFSDPRIRVIEGPRQGLVPNSVRLWDAAACDLLKFVYDDDFLSPFALAELAGMLQADPEATFAFCARDFVDDEGRVLGSPRPFEGQSPRRFSALAVAESLVPNILNPIGEPTGLLIRRSKFPDSTALSRFCDVPIRHMIDVTFFLNACRYGPCVATNVAHAAFRRHADQVTSQRNAPAFAIGFIEWELFIRGAVQLGLLPPASAARAFPRLRKCYDDLAADFPEVTPFREGLAALEAALLAGKTEVLTDAFRETHAAAGATIDARRDQAAGMSGSSPPAT